jgi:hypothetical protein
MSTPSITDSLLLRAFDNVPKPHFRTIDDRTGFPVMCLTDAVNAEYDRLVRLSRFDLDRLQRVVAIAARQHLWK